MYYSAFILFLMFGSGVFTAYQYHIINNFRLRQKSNVDKAAFGSSSLIFPLTGNVYPDGYYYATINVGQPPKPYFFDIDTGSDLTWLQCDVNGPCKTCLPAPHSHYKPVRNFIECEDPFCVAFHGPGDYDCESAPQQCDYEVEYADHGSTLGVLVKDSFSLQYSNGTMVSPLLVFGCGYDQQVADPVNVPYTDGVLGLGFGESSILTQLRKMGLTRNVVSHCLSGDSGGFLFFGDSFAPSRIVWTPMMSHSRHYSLGQADVLFDGAATNIKNLEIMFDSGSTYSYFTSQAYKALVSLIKANLNRNQLYDAPGDRSLPVCWRDAKPFKSICDVVKYFKPLALSFKTGKSSVRFQMPPEAYLIVTEHGNVCLGILDGGVAGLGNLNLIGDISLVDKMVIYDNERHRVGWAAADCNQLPKS